MTNVNDEPVKSSRKAQADVPAAPPKVEEPMLEEPVAVEAPEPMAPSGGLAAAIAKARAIKQEPLKSPRQLKQERSGVSKI